MKNKTLLIVLLVLILLLGGAYVLYQNLSRNDSSLQLSTLPRETQASEQVPATSVPQNPDLPAETQSTEMNWQPDFTVFDREGNSVQLSQFIGKPVVLNFWSSNCMPCRYEMPDFQKAYEAYGEDVHFVMVNITDGSWDTQESAQRYVDQEGFTFPIYFDRTSEAQATMGVYSFPTTFFLNRDGSPEAYRQGVLSAPLLQQGIDMILK